MSVNLQKPSPVDRRKDGWLHIHHVFHTIQGEGIFTGWPSVFIRLHGCNIQCPACDTDYTTRDDLLQPDNILSLVKLNACHFLEARPAFRPLVVITGGEPFRQNLIPLIRLLHVYGYIVQIETNGTLWLEGLEREGGVPCHIICSPKTPRINEQLAKRADAFKYVLQHGHVSNEDGLPLDTMLNPGHQVARPPLHSATPIYVQPLDETFVSKDRDPALLVSANNANMQAAVESCMRFGYRLSVQTHKIANLE